MPVPECLSSGWFGEAYAPQTKLPARRLVTRMLASCTAFQQRQQLLLLQQRQRAIISRLGRDGAAKIKLP